MSLLTCFNTATSGSYPLRDTVDFVGKYGFQGIEIDTGRLQEYQGSATVDDLPLQLEKNGVRVAALMAFPFLAFKDRSQALSALECWCPVAKALGAPTMLCFAGDGPPQGMSRCDAMAAAVRAAGDYAAVAARSGVSIALEPIGGLAFMGGPEDALEIACRCGTDNVGIMMDTFHYYKSGVSLERIAAIPMEKMLIVHVNDAPDRPKQELNDSMRVYCGLGDIPLVEEFRILRDKGYKGYLSVEIFNREYWADTHENIVKNAKRTLDEVLGRL
jgi:2-keto-myo-inositol isomerase